jgi:hypothetical protein
MKLAKYPKSNSSIPYPTIDSLESENLKQDLGLAIIQTNHLNKVGEVVLTAFSPLSPAFTRAADLKSFQDLPQLWE